jgi:hypothetical protein
MSNMSRGLSMSFFWPRRSFHVPKKRYASGVVGPKYIGTPP